MKRLALSLVAAVALAGGFSHTSSAYDWTTLSGDQDVYASTTRLPLVAIGDCTGDAGCMDSCDDCCDCIGNWYDNTLVFSAADGWRNAGDIDFPSNFGFRTGFNTGHRLFGDSPIRGQIGASFGLYDLNGRTALADSNGAEQQVFLTGGIYKRSDVCAGDLISWGIVYDYMDDNHWGAVDENVSVGQVRAIFGYAWDEANEFGVWAAFRAQDDQTAIGEVRAQDQANAFWHHNWDFGGDTTIYSGWADDPGVATVGFFGQAPLSCSTALFGGAHYVISERSNGFDAQVTDIWNVSFGFVYYFGAKAENMSVSGHQGLPLLPVADNGTFAIQNGF
jgi:hypothetical protein